MKSHGRNSPAQSPEPEPEPEKSLSEPQYNNM